MSRWTVQEEQELKKIYLNYSLTELEIIFQRSRHAICRKAFLLGVNKYKPRQLILRDYDVCLHLITMRYKIRATGRRDAYLKAVQKLKSNFHSRKNFEDIVMSSKSTIIYSPNDKN